MKKTADSFKVFDKVKWHYPEGEGCPSLEAAKRHIDFAMNFLQSHGLLSEDGEDLFVGETVDSDFALTSEVVTPLGNALLSESYDAWLKEVTYDGPLSIDLFELNLKKLQQEKKPSTSAKKTTGRKKRTKQAPPSEDDSDEEPILYDRVDFHWPMAKGRGCKSLEDAKVHFKVVTRWLAAHDLLSQKGTTSLRGKDIPDDFALTEEMLTEQGNAVMMKAYDRWLATIPYGTEKEPDTKILDKALKNLKD